MPQEHYLDTNAVTYLYSHREFSEDQLATVRHRLAARESSVVLLASPSVIQELVPIRRHDWRLFQRLSSDLRHLVGRGLLEHTNHLVEAELHRCRAVRETERLLTREDRRGLWSLFRSARVADAVARQTREETEEFKRDEERHRETVRSQFNRPHISRSLREWWSDVEPVVEDWAREFIRGRGRPYLPAGVDPESVDPKSIQALWHFYAYKMARIYLNVGEGRRIQPSDLLDAHHFVGASYAGVLVTDDRAFRETIDVIPGIAFRVLTFPEFVQVAVAG